MPRIARLRGTASTLALLPNNSIAKSCNILGDGKTSPKATIDVLDALVLLVGWRDIQVVAK
jgi:hypothetical protein